MKNNILNIVVLGSLSVSVYAQETTYFPTSNMEVTAVVDAGCDLTAENINFGILAMPLQDNTAQSNMNIKCSKGANLELAINYSDNVSNASSEYTIVRNQTRPQGNGPEYEVYNSSGSLIGSMGCGYPETYPNHVFFSTKQLADLYNTTRKPTSPLGWQPDTTGACNTSNFIPNTPFVSNQGVLKGISLQEKINYSLELPDNSSKIWNSSNKYSILATGDNQVIPMKANIKRASNSNHHYSPDTYQSILTVVLSY